MCFLFSLNYLKFPLTRETDTPKKLSNMAELLKSDNLQYDTLVRWFGGTNDSETKGLMF